jgi:hypothetical protein
VFSLAEQHDREQSPITMNLIWALKLLRSSPPESSLLLSTRDVSPNPADIALTDVTRKGLIAISVLAVLSTAATFGLLSFITYRLIFWYKYHKNYLGYNQYIILIYQLLLADLQQSLAFLICTRWLFQNSIRANTAACFLQGFWLQVGDPGSGLFVLAIAIHTFMLVTSGRKLEHKWFVTAVVGVWAFLAILVIVPLASHGGDVFVPSGAWVSIYLCLFHSSPADHCIVLDQRTLRDRSIVDALPVDLPGRVRHRGLIHDHVYSTETADRGVGHSGK